MKIELIHDNFIDSYGGLHFFDGFIEKSRLSRVIDPLVDQNLNIPGTFWFGRFDVEGKMDHIEEMTERNPDTTGVGIECGKSTFVEGTEKPSFRVGEGIRTDGEAW